MFLITRCLVSLVEFSTLGNGNETRYDYRAHLVRDSSPSCQGQQPLSGFGSSGHFMLSWMALPWMQPAVEGDSVALADCSVAFSSQPWLCWFILRQLPQDGSVAIIWLNLPHLISSGNVSPGSMLAAVHPTKEDPYLSPSWFPHKFSSVAFYWHCQMGLNFRCCLWSKPRGRVDTQALFRVHGPMNRRHNHFSIRISIKTIKLKPPVIHDKRNKRPSVFLRTEGSTKANDLKWMPLRSISTIT